MLGYRNLERSFGDYVRRRVGSLVVVEIFLMELLFHLDHHGDWSGSAGNNSSVAATMPERG